LTEKNKPKIFYGYIIVLVGFSIQTAGAAILATYGVFFTPLLNEFGCTRAMISGVFSLFGVMMGLFSIIAGRLGDRLGPRITMVGCSLFLGLGCLLVSQANAIWQLYLFYGVVMAIGVSGIDVLPLSTVARWFVKRRGVMSGIIKAGAGIGISIMPLVASWLISSYGWRTSYLVLGGMALVVIMLAAQFLRRDSGQKGLAPYSTNERDTHDLSLAGKGISLRETIHLRQLWITSAISMLILYCVGTIIVHIIPYALDLGISMANAAAVLAIIGGVSIVGRVVMGSAGDRLGTKWAVRICLLTLAASLFWLQLARELWMLYLFAAVYGFAHGGFFALLAPLVARQFGLNSLGTLYGFVFFFGTVGNIFGPVLAGYIFDITGSYRLGFLICALLAVTSFIISLRLRTIDSRTLQSVGGI